MEAENIKINNNHNKKRSSRKPLADCTNLSPSSSTSSTNNIPSSSSFKKPSILSFSLHKFPNTKNKPGSTPSHKTPASKSAAVSPPTPSHPPESSPLPGNLGFPVRFFFLSSNCSLRDFRFMGFCYLINFRHEWYYSLMGFYPFCVLLLI